MREERGKGGHGDDVGIALYTGHECRLGEGGLQVVDILHAANAVALRGIFTDEDLGALTVISIIAVTIDEEPLGCTIEMFVYDIGILIGSQLRPGNDTINTVEQDDAYMYCL